ncbi:hypothetical protein HY009_06650, partial [Candidatus Acetothermia bacterium]|nr:hypothetical protein [Candidatus Acetothermia bacterium]
EIEAGRLHRILTDLGLRVLHQENDLLLLESSGTSSFREIDLVDAIARVLGHEEIRAQLPTAGFSVGRRDRLEEFKDRIRRVLVSLGYDEACNEGLLSVSDASSLAPESLVKLRPLEHAHEPALTPRPTLLIGLLHNVQHNLEQQVESVRLFEIGKSFQCEGTNVREQLALGVALAGRAKLPLGGSAQFYDFQNMKGLAESLLLELGLRNFVFESGASSKTLLDSKRSLVVKAKEEPLGCLGTPRPDLFEKFSLKPEPLFLMELDLERIFTRLMTLSTPIWFELKPKVTPAYPFLRRAFSVAVPASISEGSVRWVLEGEKRVESIFLSELRSSGDRKIFSYEIILRDWNKALTQPEVDEMMARLKSRLVQELNAEVQ